MSLTVGLTGGIASGKSLVGELFREHGVSVTDADLVARDVVAPGQPGLARLVEHFGTGILEADGSLARRRMRERVFADAEARQWLESLLHPLIHAELGRRRDAAPGEYQVLMIPLMVRTGMRDLVSRVLVVDAPETLQIERLMRRDGISQALAQAMLAAQESRQQRLEAADDVLFNDGNPDHLREPVSILHKHYQLLAQGRVQASQRLHLPLPPIR